MKPQISPLHFRLVITRLVPIVCRKFILLILLIFLVEVATAQVTTGGLTGKLISNEGNPVEGANLVLTGSSMQGTMGTTTDENGVFFFKTLPIGTYKLSITHVSFSAHEMNDVSVRLGQVTNLGLIILATGLTQLEEVVILPTSNVLSGNAGGSQSLSKSTLDKIPVGRDFKEAITVLPQVNTSYYGDGLSIAGGTGSENMFYLDGINVTAIYTPPGVPSTFTATGFLPYNFIKEVKVSSSGFEAQYGRTLGGNVDVVTQSGSNDFRGQVFGFISGSFLNSEPKDGTTGSAIDKTSNYDAGFSFGGPIIKDKLWYYTAYSYYYNERGVEVEGHGFYPDKTINHVLAGKLDWLVTPNTKLNLTLLGNPSKSTPVYGVGGPNNIYTETILNLESVLGKFESGGINAIVNGYSQLNQNLQLDYSVNYYHHRSDFGGINEFANTEPLFFDLTTSTLSGGIGWIENNDLSKVGGKIAATYKINKHNFKLGFEAEYNLLSGQNSTCDLGNIMYNGSVYTVSYTFTDQNLNSTSYTGYIQDNWMVTNRLSLQLGFRWDDLILWDDNYVFQEFNNQFQPRIGISWFMNDAETKKFSFYYGRVYQNVNPLYGRVYTNKSLYYDSLYTEDPRTPGAVPYDGTLWSPSGDLAYQPGKYNLDNMDVFHVEYQQMIGSNLNLRISGLYKYLRDAFFLAFDSTNNYQNSFVGNPGKDDLSFLPSPVHEYWALEIGLTGNHFKHFSYSVNYIWSKNYGNYPGGYVAEDHGPVFLGFNSGVNTQVVKPNSTGLLPNDRTHVIKLNASYAFKFGLTAGTYFTLQSGTPLSEWKPSGAPTGRIYLEKRGSSGRTPMLWDLNFRFGYQPQKFPAKFYLDIFHIGDPQSIVDRVQSKYLDTDETLLDPNFGKPVSYQPPMALRLGVEFNF
jgi:hypothetical protein